MKNTLLFLCLICVVAGFHLSILHAKPASGAMTAPIRIPMGSLSVPISSVLTEGVATLATESTVESINDALRAASAPMLAPFATQSQGLLRYIASASLLASANFDIPLYPPETVIKAKSMHIQSGTTMLLGEVKALRGTDMLICEKAFLHQKPDWILASMAPCLFRKESVPDKKAIRETTLNALNILWSTTSNQLEASTSVTVKVEERTWDMATYTWVIISSDEMVGDRKSSQMIFSGNVTMRDKSSFGKGAHLTYDKASSTAILSGDARIEREKWNIKEKKMVTDILTGATVTYNLNTKQASSE